MMTEETFMMSKLKRTKAALTAISTLSVAFVAVDAGQAKADDTPFIGEMMLTAANYCPTGWLPAYGQVLNIADYVAVFPLFGTTFGGDGLKTFAMPDLRGRAPVHTGTGVDLMPVKWGQQQGSETVQLSEANLPSHTHTVMGAKTDASTTSPSYAYLAKNRILEPYLDGPLELKDLDATMNSGMIAPSGTGAAFSIVNPLIAMTWCVSVAGSYPPKG